MHRDDSHHVDDLGNQGEDRPGCMGSSLVQCAGTATALVTEG